MTIRRLAPVAIALTLASVVYCLPLFTGLDKWGRQDWDQFTFRYETPRTSILRDGELPVWNPYAAGGTVLLAHPDSPALSPWYAIVLALGAPIGLRVQVLLFMVIGSIGMAVFVTTLGASRLGAVAAGIAFMMSSHFGLHMAEGHLEWCVLALMPWLLVLLGRDSVRSAVGAAALLASVLTFGAVYVPAIYLPAISAWVVFECIRRRRAVLLARWAAICVAAVLLAAPKLLPVIDFVSTHPRPPEVDVDAPLALAPVMFGAPRQDLYYKAYRDRELPSGHFARALTPAEAFPYLAALQQARLGFNFHEFGCYVGAGGWLLVAIGLVASLRRLWPIYAVGALAVVTVFGSNAPIHLWAWLQTLPLYGQLHVASRFLMVVVLVLATAVAFGVTRLAQSGRDRARWRPVLAAALVAAMYVELAALGWRLLSDVFVVPRIERTHYETFAHRCSERDQSYRHVMDSEMMPCLTANSGDLAAYENLAVSAGKVTMPDAAGYRGEAFLERSAAPVSLASWTMARVVVQVSLDAADRVVLNQNFAKGWRAIVTARDGSIREVNAEPNADGLITAQVEPTTTHVEFYYLAPGFRTGMLLFLPTLIVCGVLLFMSGRRRITGRGERPFVPR